MKIGYARISTVDQSNDLQIDALKESGCDHIFEETASGAQRDRPQLAALLDYAREGDTIIVWRLDRLARSLRQLIETAELLEDRGVALQSIQEAIDTSSAGGKLIFQIFGALAEFERSLIRERTLAGLEAARRQGRVGGRPKSLDDEDIKFAVALLKDESITVAKVAERLAVSPSTLYRHLPGGRSGIPSVA